MSTDSWQLDDIVENGWESIFTFFFNINGLLGSAGEEIYCWITKIIANYISETLEMKPKTTRVAVVFAIPMRFVGLGANCALLLRSSWEPDFTIHAGWVGNAIIVHREVPQTIVDDFVGREPIFLGSQCQFSRGKIIRISVVPVRFNNLKSQRLSCSRRKLSNSFI